MIVNDGFEVASELAQIDGLLAEQGNYEGVPVTSGDGTTSDDTLPLPIVPTFLAFLIAIPILNKRKD